MSEPIHAATLHPSNPSDNYVALPDLMTAKPP